MFKHFKFESLPLAKIFLDERNPRIVSQRPLSSQAAILRYFYEHEDLERFTQQIASEGKNPGAERPYVVEENGKYIAIEGNTRIAAYKLLTGLIKPPAEFYNSLPTVSEDLKSSLLTVDCSIAPTRISLLPIVARAHFGNGDKSKWSYLGSRKALYDDLSNGMSVPALARAFNISQSTVRNNIVEYKLYLFAIKLKWSKAERDVLLNPGVEFNPPIRFLQTSGHKEKLGVTYDTANMDITFKDEESVERYQHLIRKLVVSPERGLGATAMFDDVFQDFSPSKKQSANNSDQDVSSSKENLQATDDVAPDHQPDSESREQPTESQRRSKPKSLFSYQPSKIHSGLLSQLMREASRINCETYPAAGTFLLRSIVETVLKELITRDKANKVGATLNLEKCLDICASAEVTLSQNNKKILKDFRKSSLDYLNLGAHGEIVPNFNRLTSARDTIDQFIKDHI